MRLRRTKLADDAFDVAVSHASDDLEQVARAFSKAGVEARIILHEQQDPVIKVRHEDLPRLQDVLERQRL